MDTSAEKIKIEDLQNVNNTVSHNVYSKQSSGIVQEDSIKRYYLGKNSNETLKVNEDFETSNGHSSNFKPKMMEIFSTKSNLQP